MRPSRLRGLLPWLALVAGVALIVVVAGRPDDEGLPLDPASPKPLGTKGLVDTLRGLGATVEVGAEGPGPDTQAALVLSDDLDDQRRQALLAWTREGGTLVVADPGSPLTDIEPAGGTGVGPLEAALQRRCDYPPLRDVHLVAAPGGVVFEVPEGARGCFPRGEGAWLVAQPLGDGTVVRLGGAGSLTNDLLDEADNAVLAASLLAPRQDATVEVLQPPPPGGGNADLLDLIAPRVKTALWQLGVAFALLALWRARRLGRPVLEPQPVQIPGSEIVVAVGHLLQRARGRAQAAGVLADDLRRTLAERLGLPAGVPPEQVAEVVDDRTGVPRERVLAALRGPSPRDEAELVALAQTVESVRREVTSVR